MSQKFVLDLDEDCLIFLTEVMVFNYIILKLKEGLDPSVSFVENILRTEIASSLEDSLRSLLRGPLKSSVFRKRFNTHFAEHPNELLCTLGVEVLDEVLTLDAE